MMGVCEVRCCVRQFSQFILNVMRGSGIWQITRVWARMICSTLRNSSTWATLKTFIKGAKLIHNHEIL